MHAYALQGSTSGYFGKVFHKTILTVVYGRLFEITSFWKIAIELAELALIHIFLFIEKLSSALQRRSSQTSQPKRSQNPLSLVSPNGMKAMGFSYL